MPQAIPGQSSSTPPAQGVPLPRGGILRLVTNQELDQQAAADRQAQEAADSSGPADDIASFVKTQWTIFRNNRNNGDDPLNDRLLRAQRMFNGKYDPEKLRQILAFGGSLVYSRLVAVKCRGATSLLRDVYLGPDRPWDIAPQPDPPVPPEIMASIMKLAATEVAGQQQGGQPVLEDQVHARVMGLTHAAQQAARRNAMTQTQAASDKIDDILVEGRFYEAVGEFLIDIPLFPFACIKGPVVRMVPRLTWSADGTPTMKKQAQMFWERVSPFDIYWTPGVSNISDADTIERKRFTRGDLNDLIGLPGYDETAIRSVLADYARGFRDWLDTTDSERSRNEGREDPTMNQSMIIDGLEYNGVIQGQMLLDAGMDPKLITDPLLDYSVKTIVVGRYTIKTQLNPNPRQRHPYYITSFEKTPGTIAGHGLPDLLEDLQEICNAALRSLVNNMSIASGPQVVVNDEQLSPSENGDELYPWKRWHVQSDPLGSQGKPVEFFQPQSNAQELLDVYQAITKLADEISAIPSYITGSSNNMGGAGRTASGLSMLMNNAEKVLQTVAANIDNDVMEPMLLALYDMIMLTDKTRMLTGEEEIRVRGVNVAVQQETERSKQLQFLQITANPIDAPIVGPLGRARVLRAVASGLGLPDDVVPDDQQIQAQIAAQQQTAQAQAMQQTMQGQPPGAQPGAPAGPGAPPGPAAQAQGAQAPKAPPAQASDHAPPVNLMQQGVPFHG